jgi:hypothetical protein
MRALTVVPSVNGSASLREVPDPARCEECMECDFTPTLCPPEAPGCAQVSGSQ